MTFGTLPDLPDTAGEARDRRFAADPRPGKFTLATGVFLDAEGRLPLLECVRRAEEGLLRSREPKRYTEYEGDGGFRDAVQRLLLGREEPRARTLQTPGGTAALRLAGELLRKAAPGVRAWVPDPTWDNHIGTLKAAGVEVLRHPYVPGELPPDAKPGDAVLLHACCHNPTGLDPTPAQWAAMAASARERGLLPVLDLAFLGYAEGIEADLLPVRTFAKSAPELLVCLSLSKSMELYGERVGSLTILAEAPEGAFRHARRLARVNWSRPPAHGAAIAAAVLGDPALRALWEEEVAGLRARIRRMRGLLAAGLPAESARILSERGIFTRIPLAPGQAERLEKDSGIYLLASGRMNVVAMTESQLARLLEALRA